MTGKRHGPGFRKDIIPLTTCPECCGMAVIKGVFHELDCESCNASGWVRFDNGQKLELQDLVTQLGFNLRLACKQIRDGARRPDRYSGGPESGYYQNNRRGAGGTNYTGD